MKSSSKVSLGQNLRKLRKKLGLTISEVNELTGLASSTISKVENDRMSLTYDKLYQLAAGLQIDIASLFQPKAANSVTARYAVDRPKDRLRVTAGKYDYWYLSTSVKLKAMTPMLGRTRYKSIEEFGDYIRHPGEEFIFVTDGKIVVHTEYYEPVVLNMGDSLYLDSSMGHAYLAGDEGPCQFVSVCTGDTEEGQLEQLRRPSIGGRGRGRAAKRGGTR
jgi:transcriptional regulator with XRE-family HTH domain